jgi:ubiquinone/menaquinone biosynthesis C-methylase UbiE
MPLNHIIETYNSKAEVYARSSVGTENKKMLQQFVRFIKSPAKILDVGCAAGRDARVLKDMGYDVVGVDMAEKLLAIARASNPDISFVAGDMRQLPFEDASFDGVWASGVLHHVERGDMIPALQEFHRVLKTGGILHVYTKAGKGKLLTREASVAYAEREFTLLSAKDLGTMAKDAGFSKLVLEERPSKSRKGLIWLSAFFKKATA